MFARAAWAESYRLFEAADREAPLEPEDLERLATAAYLMGRDDESEAAEPARTRLFLARGDHEGAARSASWLAFGLLQRGAIAPASGWFARAERILDEAHLDSVVRGFLLIPSAIQRIVQGDPRQVTPHSRRRPKSPAGLAIVIWRRWRAADAGGRSSASDSIAEGVALLDEAMVAVIAGDVTPVLAGDIYCIVLEACQETFDLRSRQRVDRFRSPQWCAAQPELVRYRGECLLYRAEVMQSAGKWDDAAQDAKTRVIADVQASGGRGVLPGR